ncbi:MAG: apolipoprotein N-acyltransferase [Phycisphaerae bacterium]|nr:apolipoprotein N-acyltransferase [Phycisphaerae bacterium]
MKKLATNEHKKIRILFLKKSLCSLWLTKIFVYSCLFVVNFKKDILPLLCFGLSAVLLTVIQVPFGFSFCAWFALVPFVIAAIGAEKIRPVIFASYIISLVYWLGNIYWLGFTTIAGWLVFCFYIAFYWPILAISLRYCFLRKIPLWFSAPILFVGAEAIQGWMLKGFAWRYLAHSQFENIILIQIADIFGAAGVSFLIAMVNGLIAEVIIDAKKKLFFKPANVIGAILTAIAIIATLFYGKYRIVQTADFVEAGPRISVVQSNVPVKAGEETVPPDISFIDMLLESRRSLAAEPNLIIWPETMVETIFDDGYLNLVGQGSTAKIYHNALVRHSSEGVCLLVGAFSSDAYLTDNNEIKFSAKYNTAFLYEPNSSARQYYDKIYLVPFGEYIPLKNLLPFLYKIMMNLTPYTYDYTLDAGRDFTVFKMNSGRKVYRFAVMICYEDTLPKSARRFTIGTDNRKKIDWLVNISNDGWFVRQKDEKIIPSTELAQHTAISVFRAVENRTPVIRSVNTGISCYIDSLGRIRDDFIAGNLPKKAFDRAGKGGWFADQILIDKRITVFSRLGQRLDITCAICLIFTAFVSIYKYNRQ